VRRHFPANQEPLDSADSQELSASLVHPERQDSAEPSRVNQASLESPERQDSAEPSRESQASLEE